MRFRLRLRPWRRAWLAGWCGWGAGLLLAAGSAPAGGGVAIVRAERVTDRLEAYAEGEPIAVLPVRAALAGVVAGRGILPGDRMRAGQPFATLGGPDAGAGRATRPGARRRGGPPAATRGGPDAAAALAEDEAAVQAARTGLAGALESLAIERRQAAAHLGTRQRVIQSESGAAQARAGLDSARARLQALKGLLTLAAPADGTVLAVNAADGERVAAGGAVFTLEPAGKLWLRASFYGADAAAIRAGMTGAFAPAGGGKTVPVKVGTIFGALSPDGGESAGLFSTAPSPDWLGGESGRVTLNGRTRSLISVPTRALILDRGRWWVLVRSAQGDRPRAVVPGPTRGWRTFIVRGLQPGTPVVVENAYLEFHQGIAKTYQPPD